jgi:hypothetical protein
VTRETSFIFRGPTCRIPAMHRTRLRVAALALLAFLPSACDGGGGNATGAEGAAIAEKAREGTSPPAATVDGEEIGIDEVRALMEESDAGLSAEQALDALIEERLLAREAARRDIGGVDVDIERERAMAYRLLLKIRDETTVDSIDERTLEGDYARQRERFVHGVERRVVHAVARTGKRGMKDPAAAEALARRIRDTVDGAASEVDFSARVKPFQKEAGAALKVEHLPPFAAETRRFDRVFVDAAFAVPKVGAISPVFRTSFGWHVMYVMEELPSENVPFAEARRVLAEERLQQEREKRTVQLLQRLTQENPVFLYESPVAAAE